MRGGNFKYTFKLIVNFSINKSNYVTGELSKHILV